jgi:hypothetical protein
VYAGLRLFEIGVCGPYDKVGVCGYVRSREVCVRPRWSRGVCVITCPIELYEELNGRKRCMRCMEVHARFISTCKRSE